MAASRIRGETRMTSDEIEYRYRPQGLERSRRRLSVYNFTTRDGMNRLAVDVALDAAYALDKLNGRTALYRVPLDGIGRRELLVSHDEVDVDGVLRLAAAAELLAPPMPPTRRQMLDFDPELRRAPSGCGGTCRTSRCPLRWSFGTKRASC